MPEYFGPQQFQSQMQPRPMQMQMAPPQQQGGGGFGWHSVGLGDPLKRASVSKGMIGLGMGLLSQQRGESWASALGRGIGQADAMSRQGREDYEAMQSQERDDKLRGEWASMAEKNPEDEEMYKLMELMSTDQAVNLYANRQSQKATIDAANARAAASDNRWYEHFETTERGRIRREGRALKTQLRREERDLTQEVNQEGRLQTGREEMADYNQEIQQEAYRTKWIDNFFIRQEAETNKYIAEIDRENRLRVTTLAAEDRAEERYVDHRDEAEIEWDYRQQMMHEASIERSKLNREAKQRFKMSLESVQAKESAAEIMNRKLTGETISERDKYFLDQYMEFNALFRIVQDATARAAYNLDEDVDLTRTGSAPKTNEGIPTGRGIDF